jgi:hypothetical protein
MDQLSNWIKLVIYPKVLISYGLDQNHQGLGNIKEWTTAITGNCYWPILDPGEIPGKAENTKNSVLSLGLETSSSFWSEILGVGVGERFP